MENLRVRKVLNGFVMNAPTPGNISSIQFLLALGLGTTLRIRIKLYAIILRNPVPPQDYDGKDTQKLPDVFKTHSAKLKNFKRNLTTWIAVSHQAFLVIEEPTFLEMIGDLSIEAASMVPKSTNTVRQWVVKEFQRQKLILIEKFQISKLHIHFFDGPLDNSVWESCISWRCGALDR